MLVFLSTAYSRTQQNKFTPWQRQVKGSHRRQTLNHDSIDSTVGPPLQTILIVLRSRGQRRKKWIKQRCYIQYSTRYSVLNKIIFLSSYVYNSIHSVQIYFVHICLLFNKEHQGRVVIKNIKTLCLKYLFTNKWKWFTTSSIRNTKCLSFISIHHHNEFAIKMCLKCRLSALNQGGFRKSPIYSLQSLNFHKGN